MEENPKAKYGHSSDKRTDCLQLVIALVITADGFPSAYEVMDGNTSGRTTLRDFLDKIEKTYGKAKRMWVMDRGIPTEEILQEMRDPAREIFYLMGTAKGKIQQYEKKWLDLPWQQVRDSVDVKLFEQDGELYVLAKSEGRRAKETAMRRKRLARLLRKLRAMRRNLPSRDQLLMRLGAAKAQAGRAFHFVHLEVPGEDRPVTRETFQFRVDKQKLQEAEWRDGHYLLRSNLTTGDPSVLWTRYVQLTQIEAVFRSLKSELCIRPIRHQLEHRADAHILIAFLAYCLQVTLKQRLLAARTRANAYGGVREVGGNQNDRRVDSCGRSTMVDSASLHATFPRHQDAEKLKFQLPSQPPPRLVAQKESYEIEVLTVR
jgi:transposase